MLTSFAPALNGVVESIEAAPGGGALFVGGNFSTVNGVSNFGIAKLDAVTGTMVPGFNAVSSGKIRDLAVSGNKLYMGGDFWAMNGVDRRRMAAIDATTGALDPSFTVGTSAPKVSLEWVDKIDVSPLGNEMVAIGNFVAINGLPRQQIVRIDLSGAQATVMPWATNQFGDYCIAQFWQYLRDVEYSPAGDFFAVATTGGPVTGRLCDTASRWETSSQSSTALETWANWSGGDTLTAVAISDVAVYIGGHQRWLNNHTGNNLAGPGAVSRPGIAALEPLSGVPLSWNPGKDRGIAVWDLHLADSGLYVGSDSDFTAGEYHAKLAQFPLAGGAAVPRVVADNLPTTLFSGEGGTTLTRRSFDGVTVGAASTVAGNPITWSSVGDSFVEGGRLYSIGGGTLTSRPFDGITVGASRTEPSWTAWNNVTAAAWDRGRLYYVESNSSTLKYRYFSIESGIVGSQTFSLPGPITWSGIAGMDFAGGKLYYARTDGNLWVVDMANGAPVNGTQVLVSGPAKGDGQNWNDPAFFVLGADAAPTVSITNPADNARVSGAVTISATAADAEGISRVSFFVGGTLVGTDTSGSDGWSVSWNSPTANDGPATITATVIDTSGQTASDTAPVLIDNLGPNVTLTAPTNGSTVTGPITVTATATDLLGVAQVQFRVNGAIIGTDTNGTDGWASPWNTVATANGPATVTATATDTGGRTAVATVNVTVSNVDPPAGSGVVMVVASPTALLAGEIAVRDRLAGLGNTVTIIDDNLAATADANGAKLVLISSSVASNLIGTKFRDVTVPVWMAKPFLLDDMGMTGPTATTDYGNAPATDIVITNPTHPLAAGLSGTVTTTTSAQETSYGTPGPNAITIATANTRPTTFLYPPGTTLANGNPAPACRITHSIFQNAPTTHTAQGWALFDATANHATTNCPGAPPPVAPRVVMVVASPTALLAGEIAVRDRLAGLGNTVTIIDDNLAATADANGAKLVLISSSVASNLIGTKFRDVTVPVWMAKPFLLDDMGMTGPTATTDYGNAPATDIVITNPTHPLAAGLSGTVTTTTSAQETSYGTPGPNAITIATANTRPTTFLYPPGTTLANGNPAPACRITHSIFQNAPTTHTAQGWALFDATANHATTNCPV